MQSLTDKIAVVPECRYGHGVLEMLTHTGKPGNTNTWFSIFGTWPSGQTDLRISFVMRAYRCKLCTYIELHDVPDEEFKASVRRYEPQNGADAEEVLNG